MNQTPRAFFKETLACLLACLPACLLACLLGVVHHLPRTTQHVILETYRESGTIESVCHGVESPSPRTPELTDDRSRFCIDRLLVEKLKLKFRHPVFRRRVRLCEKMHHSKRVEREPWDHVPRFMWWRPNVTTLSVQTQKSLLDAHVQSSFEPNNMRYVCNRVQGKHWIDVHFRH